MRIYALTCAAALAALPASAQEMALRIELLPGHPIYHEHQNEAGVAMALAITPGNGQAADLVKLCEELRVTAGLGHQYAGLRLETIFVVPYKGMVVEGYYWPNDGSLENSMLIPRSGVARKTLDDIVARAGIPPPVLSEMSVEHEISCSLDEPFWYVAWYDVRRIGEEEPGAVIERARQRFLAIHQSVLEHAAAERHLYEARERASVAESAPTRVGKLDQKAIAHQTRADELHR